MNLTDQLHSDVGALQRATDAATYALENAARSLNSAHSALWTLPDERLAAVLNELGPQKVQEVFTAHNETAVALNASLSAAGSSVRAIDVAGREIEFDGEAFSVVALPQPEPPAEPQPEEPPTE